MGGKSLIHTVTIPPLEPKAEIEKWKGGVRKGKESNVGGTQMD